MRKQRPYLLLIVGMFIISAAVPALNYVQLDREGIYSTVLGFIRKRIRWSDVESVGKASLGNADGVGILYKSSVNRYIFGRKFRRKTFGWDELLPNAHRSDGASLLDDAVESFKKYSSGQKGGEK